MKNNKPHQRKKQVTESTGIAYEDCNQTKTTTLKPRIKWSIFIQFQNSLP
jgi:hypothetical protein